MISARMEALAGFRTPGRRGIAYRARAAAATRPLAVRLDVDYLDTFDRLDSIGGHLLVETASRFGLAASCEPFRRTASQRRPRSASTWATAIWSTVSPRAIGPSSAPGSGLNWLSDSCGADLGFNFTYAADLYPRKPWVLSATIDCGTLGQTGLFRFRTTAGVVFHGVETYAGYEYTDIGRTHWNGLIAGLRFWF